MAHCNYREEDEFFHVPWNFKEEQSEDDWFVVPIVQDMKNIDQPTFCEVNQVNLSNQNKTNDLFKNDSIKRKNSSDSSTSDRPIVPHHCTSSLSSLESFSIKAVFDQIVPEFISSSVLGSKRSDIHPSPEVTPTDHLFRSDCSDALQTNGSIPMDGVQTNSKSDMIQSGFFDDHFNVLNSNSDSIKIPKLDDSFDWASDSDQSFIEVQSPSISDVVTQVSSSTPKSSSSDDEEFYESSTRNESDTKNIIPADSDAVKTASVANYWYDEEFHKSSPEEDIEVEYFDYYNNERSIDKGTSNSVKWDIHVMGTCPRKVKYFGRSRHQRNKKWQKNLAAF